MVVGFTERELFLRNRRVRNLPSSAKTWQWLRWYGKFILSHSHARLHAYIRMRNTGPEVCIRIRLYNIVAGRIARWLPVYSRTRQIAFCHLVLSTTYFFRRISSPRLSATAVVQLDIEPV